ncbi:MAG TPA: O-antigen ligase family protein [Acetobacteraceae bacterium]|nr:O-antigen ligase family protein [Acetobacteraceae bacterium]
MAMRDMGEITYWLRIPERTRPAAREAGFLPALCFSALIFLVFIGPWPPILSGDYGGEEVAAGTGDAVRQASFVLLFALVASTVAFTRGARHLLDVPLPLAVLLFWAWLSLAWAVDPATSLRRVLLTSMVLLSVCWTVAMLGHERVLRQLGLWFAAILVLNWAVMPLVETAVHQHGELDEALVGNWRGIHDHKNAAGAFCAIAILTFLHLTARTRSWLLGPVLILMAAVFLVMTASKTSLGLVGVAILGGLAFEAGYRNPGLRNVALVLGGCAILLAAAFFGDRIPDVVAFFEDPGSLTGRVQIWPVLLEYAANNLLLGSGYGSFWAIGPASPLHEYATGWVTTVTHGHNGYLDLLVQLGLVGLLLGLLVLVLLPVRALLSEPLHAPGARWLLGALFVFLWLHNLLETSFLDRANMMWVMFLTAYALLHRRAR